MATFKFSTLLQHKAMGEQVDEYCKIPKYLDTRKIAVIILKLEQSVMSPKDADAMANSVDPDQTAPRSSLIRVYTVCLDVDPDQTALGAVWSGSILFAMTQLTKLDTRHTCMYENLRALQ